MLVLSRRANESVVVGTEIVVKVLSIKKNVVRLGIEAPPEVPVHRGEVRDRIEFEVSLASPESVPVSVSTCVSAVPALTT